MGQFSVEVKELALRALVEYPFRILSKETLPVYDELVDERKVIRLYVRADGYNEAGQLYGNCLRYSLAPRFLM